MKGLKVPLSRVISPCQPQQVAEFFGHKYGVNCVAFSPSNKYVVSIGTQHDMIVNLWDWRNNIKVASNKVSTKVKAIAFSENGNYFVTVGNRHVKFWFLETGKTKYKEAVPLMGRSAILGEQRNNYFCDVACGKGECGDSTYAITRSGLLCEFNNRRLLDKWVELRTTSANCITVGQNYIFVGCADGIIRCFDPATLNFITTLPRCHYLGVDVSQGTTIQHMASPPPDAKYPDTIAITYDELNNKLTAVYNDHSIYVWDVFNVKRVGKSCSFLYHSACIWGVEMAPVNSPLPAGSFLTCSSDDTIRVWTLDKMNERDTRGMYHSNIYSNELLKVVYVDKDLSYIKDLDISGTSNEKQPEQTSYDGKNGVRSITISPDGKHLASGDRSGNIRIHDTVDMKEQFKIEAHDSEVLCLEYSSNDSLYNMLASASRDRLIHIFDTKKGYDFVQTLDDHSSSITAVRFLNHPNSLSMVSCGADKSLIFRSLEEVNGKSQFVRDHNATGKTTLYDMEVDKTQKHVLTACQDRNVRVYSVHSGKHTKTFKGSTGDDGSLIKVVLDRSGIYLATSCTDKSLSVYDYYSGECMATMCGLSKKIKSTMTVCSGPETTTSRMFNAAKSFLQNFNEEPIFAFYWLNSFSHDSVNEPSAMEELVLNFLTSSTVTQAMDNSIFVVFSDHGFRFGDIRFTYSGWLEERLPFIYVRFPKLFQDTYPDLVKNFKLNAQHRLTTPYDFYMTLQHILWLTDPTYSIQPSRGCPNCHSLFELVSFNRSCEDAGIEQHWCTCGGYTTISVTDPQVVKVASFVIGELNQLIQDEDEGYKCAEYSLRSIESVGMTESAGGRTFLMLVQTYPNAMFEATARWSNGQFTLLGSMSRLNKYKDYSQCVTNSVLKKYCFCDSWWAKMASHVCYVLKCAL